MLRNQQQLVLSGAAAVLAIVVVAPIAAMVAGGPGDDATLQPAAAGWLADVGALLARSSAIAGTVALSSVLLGMPLGLYLGRFDVPGRTVLLAMHAVPALVPPFLPGLGWYYAMQGAGVLNREEAARLFFGPAAFIVVLTASLSPIVTGLVVVAVRRVDPRLEESARVVARPQAAAWRIVAPLAAPAAALGAWVVFVFAFSELALAMFLRVRTYPAAVFVRLGGVDFAPAEAAALCLPLLALAILLLIVERAIAAGWAVAPAAVAVAEPWPLGRWRWLVTAAAGFAALAGVAPIVALVLRAGWTGFASAPGWLGRSIETSLGTSAVAATAISALGIVLGHASATRAGGAAVLDAVALGGFVVPAAVIGGGLAMLWNRPATRAVYASAAIIVLAYCARYAVIGARTMAAAIGAASAQEEEAAASVGAGYLRRLALIVVPRHRMALAATWLFAFVLCLRDLDGAIVVQPPGTGTLLTRVFTLEANAPEPLVAALAVVHVAMTLAAAALVGLVWVRSRAGR